jgi:GTP-binding protein
MTISINLRSRLIALGDELWPLLHLHNATATKSSQLHTQTYELIMDILRLPPCLRRTLISNLRPIPSYTRPLATKSNKPSKPQPQPQSAQSQPTESTQLSISSATLNDYSTSNPPNPNQLSYASHFFQQGPPNLLYSAYYFRSFPQSAHPEVAFLGRSNVGKSSLLNALFGRPNERHAYVSKKPGKTRTMNGFGVGGDGMGKAPLEGEKDAAWKRFGRGGVVVVDMPGYGGGSREEWGKEALKYLTQRKQLRRTFVLIDAEHGLKSSDVALLTHLRTEGVPYSIVMSKVDKLVHPGSKPPGPQKLENCLVKLKVACDDVRRVLREAFDDGRDVRDDILCCSSEKSLDERSGWRAKLGVDELRWAILNASGLESDEMGLAKKKVRTRDVKRVSEEEVVKVVETIVESPWEDVEEDPIVQRREPKKAKEERKEEGKSYWKPEQLS